MLLRKFPEGERRSGVEETDWGKVLKLVDAGVSESIRSVRKYMEVTEMTIESSERVAARQKLERKKSERTNGVRNKN
jgi:hypothetical protein